MWVIFHCPHSSKPKLPCYRQNNICTQLNSRECCFCTSEWEYQSVWTCSPFSPSYHGSSTTWEWYTYMSLSVHYKLHHCGVMMGESMHGQQITETMQVSVWMRASFIEGGSLKLCDSREGVCWTELSNWTKIWGESSQTEAAYLHASIWWDGGQASCMQAMSISECTLCLTHCYYSYTCT